MKALQILLILLILALIPGFVCFVQWVFNAVSAEFGGPQLGFWMTWGCLILLGIVGSAFRSTGGKS